MKLGYNYKWTNYGSAFSWTASQKERERQYMTELRRYGFDKIRVHVPDYTSLGDVYRDKELTMAAKDAGFREYNCGMSSNSYNSISNKLSLSRWEAYRSFALTDDGSGVGAAIWAKQNGVPTYYLGNEEGLHHVWSTSSSHGGLTLTRVGTTATATSSVGGDFGYTNGQTVTVGGATQPEYNGSFTITVVSPSSFTYTMASDPGASGSGSFYCYDISPTELVSNLKTLATDIKTAWASTQGANPRIVLSIQCESPQAGLLESDLWIAAGKGDIDKIGFNVYRSGDLGEFYTYAKQIWDTFGTDAIVTEYAVHQTYSSTNIRGWTPSKRGFLNIYATEMMARKQVLERLGFQEHYAFLYNNYDSDYVDDWAVKMGKADSASYMTSNFVGGNFHPFFTRSIGVSSIEPGQNI